MYTRLLVSTSLLLSTLTTGLANAEPPKPKDGPLGMKFVLLPKGTTYLGWDGTKGSAKKTEINQDFEIAIHTVTQDQWKSVMGKNPIYFCRNGDFRQEGKKAIGDEREDKIKDIKDEDTKSYPVESVSWDDCQEFIKQLNEKEKAKGWVYRLPSKLEWEYACRGGATTEEECSYDFYFAKPTNDLSSKEANFNGNYPIGNGEKGPNLGRPTKVGSYLPNSLGLYDMHGNVSQWCADSANLGSPFTLNRVIRGGGWINGGVFCKVAFFDSSSSRIRSYHIGLRLVRVPLVNNVTIKDGSVTELKVPDDAKIEVKEKPAIAEAPKKSADPLSKNFKNSIGMEFVLVGKGTAWLGGSGGQQGQKKQVIEKDFYLGKYEVTQEEWKSVTGQNPSAFSRKGISNEAVKDIKDDELKRFPLENVTWDDCQLFIKLLNKKEAETGWVYRLPMEAEWEYACRGGAGDKPASAFDFYFTKPTNILLQSQANIDLGKGLKRTSKVGSYEPNSLGLHDMHGNVWEWCDDSEKAFDGSSLCVYRGSAWDGYNGRVGAVARAASPPSLQNGLLGFRLARVPSANAEKNPDTHIKNGEDLPGVARTRLGTDLYRAHFALFGTAISPDGKEISQLSGVSMKISVLSVETGKPLRSFFIGEHPVINQIFYTTDGKRLVTAGHNGIHFWDSVDGKKIKSFPRDVKDPQCSSISFSDDGTSLAITAGYIPNEFVKVKRLSDGSELGTIKPLYNSNLFSTISPDGQSLATWAKTALWGNPAYQPSVSSKIPRSVHLWDVKTAKRIASIDSDIPNIEAVRFSPDGKQIAVSGAATIQIWDIASGKLLKRFAGRNVYGQVASMAFSPDGRRLSVSAGRGAVQIFDAETGIHLSQSQVPLQSSANLYHRADGTLIAWGVDGNVLALWEAASGKILTPVAGHRSPANRLIFSPDGKQLISLAGSEMIRWELATGRQLESTRQMPGLYPSTNSPILYSPNGKYFVGGSLDYPGRTSVYETSTNQECFALVGVQGQIELGDLIAFSPDSKRLMAAVARNNHQEIPIAVLVWDVETNGFLTPLNGQRGDFSSSAFSTDGAILTTRSYSYRNNGEATDEIWSRDVVSGKILSKLQIPKNQRLLSMEYLNDRHFVTVNMDGRARIYDALTGGEVRTLEGLGDLSLMPIHMSLTVSPDRRLLAIGKSSSVSGRNASGMIEVRESFHVFVVEAASGTVRRHFEVPATAMAFSADNKTLAVALGNTTIQLFDVDQSVKSGSANKGIGIEEHWKILNDPPAPKAWESMQALIAKPAETVALIKAHVAAVGDRKTFAAQIDKRIADLDSPRYLIRETAMKELEKIATEAREPIRLALEKKTISLDLRQRLEKLAETNSKPALETDVMRPLRAIELLERINSPNAGEHLKTLAAGGDSAVTSAARDALARLNGR